MSWRDASPSTQQINLSHQKTRYDCIKRGNPKSSIIPKEVLPLLTDNDQIDIPACTKHNIHVSNVPGAVDDATADNAVFLIIGALRNFNYPLLSLRKGKWRGNSPPLGHDPEGKALGILGMGGIGRNMARKMQASTITGGSWSRPRKAERVTSASSSCSRRVMC